MHNFLFKILLNLSSLLFSSLNFVNTAWHNKQIKKCLTRSHLLSIMHSKPSLRMVSRDHLRRGIRNRIITKQNFSKTPSILHDFNCGTSWAKCLISVFNQAHSILPNSLFNCFEHLQAIFVIFVIFRHSCALWKELYTFTEKQFPLYFEDTALLFHLMLLCFHTVRRKSNSSFTVSMPLISGCYVVISFTVTVSLDRDFSKLQSHSSHGETTSCLCWCNKLLPNSTQNPWQTLPLILVYFTRTYPTCHTLHK